MLTGSIEIFGISGLTGIGSYNEKKIVNNIRKLYSMAEEKIQNSMQSFIKDLLINNPDDLQLVFEVTKLTQHSDQKISRSFSQLIPIIEDCDPEKVRTILSDISQGTKNDQQEQSRMIL